MDRAPPRDRRPGGHSARARIPAIIVGGSIAKGRETPSWDVDILLVATDAEFARRLRHLDLWYRNSAVADYPGGYVDGHVVDRQCLVDEADHGSEPARAAFRGAFVPYARIPDLEALLARIPVYPDRERREKITPFYSQFALLKGFVAKGETRADPDLLRWAATDMMLYGGRLILAHNCILYPWRKWLMYEVSTPRTSPPTSWTWQIASSRGRAKRRPPPSGSASRRSAIGGCPSRRP